MGRPTLRLEKTGRTAGLGGFGWRVDYRSDMVCRKHRSFGGASQLIHNSWQFSVGGYMRIDVELQDLPPTCTIYTIRTLLVQKCSAISLEAFFKHGDHSTQAVEMPTIKRLVADEGTIPKRANPAVDVPALWRVNQSSSPTYRWRSGRQRLPDDSVMRPTTCLG